MQIATALFSIVMTVTFVIAIARYAALNHTLEGFGHSFMDLFIKVIPVYVILAAATTVLPNIAAFADTLGGQITGTPISGPSEIFGLGLTLCGDILKGALLSFIVGGSTSNAASFSIGVLTGVIALIVCLIIIGSFTLIAFEYFFAFAQAYIRLSVKAINLGWLAGSGTKHMGEEFLAEAWAAVMRIVMTVAVVGFIVSFVPHMSTLAITSDPRTLFMAWLTLGGSSVFAALLAWKVPELAMHAGRPSVSAIHVANSAYRTATSLAA